MFDQISSTHPSQPSTQEQERQFVALVFPPCVELLAARYQMLVRG
jgi:hypothetical protein